MFHSVLDMSVSRRGVPRPRCCYLDLVLTFVGDGAPRMSVEQCTSTGHTALRAGIALMRAALQVRAMAQSVLAAGYPERSAAGT